VPELGDRTKQAVLAFLPSVPTWHMVVLPWAAESAASQCRACMYVLHRPIPHLQVLWAAGSGQQNCAGNPGFRAQRTQLGIQWCCAGYRRLLKQCKADALWWLGASSAALQSRYIQDTLKAVGNGSGKAVHSMEKGTAQLGL